MFDLYFLFIIGFKVDLPGSFKVEKNKSPISDNICRLFKVTIKNV